MREWELAIPADLYEEMRSFLFEDSERENGCYLVADSYRRAKAGVLTIRAIVRPGDDSWTHRMGDSLEPSTSFVNEAAVKADASGATLVFVHTHPSPLHPVGFSPIDNRTNRRLLPNLAEILPDRPLGSLVLGPHGFAGTVYDGGTFGAIRAMRVSGRLLRIARAHETTRTAREDPAIDPTFDRQTRAIGPLRQRALAGITVTIVGVGGVGSSVAVQLARMGIGELRLIDRDVLDDSNLSRVYGSRPSDRGKSKVAVVKRHIGTFSKTKVRAIQADVSVDDIGRELIESDMIFGCTDNLTSRAVLNDISVRYYIPLIDIGCRILSDAGGEITNATAKIQVVTPETACLWCAGTLNGRVILQEGLPEAEKRKLEEEGYYQGVERQPSIISLTSLAASVGVNKLLALLGTFGAGYASRSQIEVRDGILNEDDPMIKGDCICRKHRGVVAGRGDHGSSMIETEPH